MCPMVCGMSWLYMSTSFPLPLLPNHLQLCKKNFDIQAALQELVKTPRAKQTIEMKCWSADEAVSHWRREGRGYCVQC